MNKYAVEARGFFGLPFRYTIEASNKAEALQKGKALLEQEWEYKAGNVNSLTHGDIRVVKKLKK